MVEGFEVAAKSKGWQVDVIDTSGDIAALVSRMEDVALQKVDAMVINVDPSQIRNGLLAAKDAGIERVIYTSSIAAVGNTPKGREKTEADWQTHCLTRY